MEWSQLYDQSNPPSFETISTFINNDFRGPQTGAKQLVDLWGQINSFLQSTYGVAPKIEYSKCSAQKGWNVKYKKSGKSLCTLYPMPGFFIALVVIGNKEMTEAELLMPTCTDVVQKQYHSAQFAAGGKWLMISVNSPEALQDAVNLIKIRVRPK